MAIRIAFVAYALLLSSPVFAEEAEENAEVSWLDRPFFGLSLIEIDTAKQLLPKSARDSALDRLASDKAPNPRLKLLPHLTGDIASSVYGIPDSQSDLPPKLKGYIVTRVLTDSAAESAGIETSDVITRVNGEILDGAGSWQKQTANITAKDEVTLDVASFKKAKGKSTWSATKKVKVRPPSLRHFAKRSLKSEFDDVTNVKRWMHKDETPPTETTHLAVIFREGDGGVSSPMMRVSYVAENWLFFDSVTLAIGRGRYEFKTTKPARVTGLPPWKCSRSFESVLTEREGDFDEHRQEAEASRSSRDREEAGGCGSSVERREEPGRGSPGVGSERGDVPPVAGPVRRDEVGRGAPVEGAGA